PVAPKFRAVHVRVANGGSVVGEGLDPHINYMFWNARDLDTPVESGARDPEVLQASFEQGHHLVEPLFWQHAVARRPVEIEQLLLVGSALEELGHSPAPMNRRSLQAYAFVMLLDPGLVLVIVGFIAPRVPSGVLAEINTARRTHPMPDANRGTMMALFGGAN